MIPNSNLSPTSTNNASGAPRRTHADVDQQRTSSAGKGRFAMSMHLSHDVCISGTGNDFNSAWAGNLIRPLLPGMPTANMQYLGQREPGQYAITNNPNNDPSPSPVPFSQISSASSDDDGHSSQGEKVSGAQYQQRVPITGNARQQQDTNDESIPVVTPPPAFGDPQNPPEVLGTSSQNQLSPTMTDSTEKPSSVVPADHYTSSPLQIQFPASMPLTPPLGLSPSPFHNFSNNNTMFDVASLGFQGMSPMMCPVNFKQQSKISGHPRKRLKRSKECPSPPIYLCQCPSPVPLIPMVQQHQQPSGPGPGPVCMYPFPCPCPACSSSSKPRKHFLKSHLKQANPNAKIMYASSYQEPCNAGPPQGKARKLSSFVSGLKKRPRQKERGLRGFGINSSFPSTTQLRLRIPGMKSRDKYLVQPATPCCNANSCCPGQPIICCPRLDQQPMDSPFNQLIRSPLPRSIKTQTLGLTAGGPIAITGSSINMNRNRNFIQYFPGPELAVIRVMTGVTPPANPTGPSQGSNYSLAGTTKVEAVSSVLSSIGQKPRVVAVVDKANDAFASINDYSAGTAAVPIYSRMDKSYLAPATQSVITSINLNNAEMQTKSIKKIKFNLTEKGHDYVSSAKSTQTIKKPPLYVFERFSTTIKSKSRIDSPEASQTGQTTGKSRQSSRTTSKAKLLTKNTKST